MSAVILDATPLGILCHPRNPPHAMACRIWVNDLLVSGRRVIVPEIADYEVRRELIRRNSTVGIGHLDFLTQRLEFLPIATSEMRLAAELWAHVRRSGQPTASHLSLDADVILAAQAIGLKEAVIVATGNPSHLSRFLPSDLWSNIKP